MDVRGLGLIEEFCRVYRDAHGPLLRWVAVVKAVQWSSLPECCKTFPHADQVRIAAGVVTVFNIKGSHYRLIAAVNYAGALVVIRRIMTHKEYSEERWKDSL